MKDKLKFLKAYKEERELYDIVIGYTESGSAISVSNLSEVFKSEDKIKSFIEMYKSKKNRCWEGYEPVPGKKPYSEGSCRKKAKKAKNSIPKEHLKEMIAEHKRLIRVMESSSTKDDKEELEIQRKELQEYKDKLKDLMEKSKDKEKKPLNKPMRDSGGDKKFKVYVKDPKTGNVKTVRFGDPNMEIKRDDKERRKNFRARHNCSEKKDKTKAGYWSCKMWQKDTSVSDITKSEKEAKHDTINKSDFVKNFKKKYPKSDKELGCSDSKDLASKICRRNASKLNRSK